MNDKDLQKLIDTVGDELSGANLVIPTTEENAESLCKKIRKAGFCSYIRSGIHEFEVVVTHNYGNAGFTQG